MITPRTTQPSEDAVTAGHHVRMTADAPAFVPAVSGAVSYGEATLAGSTKDGSSLENETRPEEILCALCQQRGIATHCSTCDRRCRWRCLSTCGRCGAVDCEQHAADNDDRCPAIRRMPLPPLQKGWADANFNAATAASVTETPSHLLHSAMPHYFDPATARQISMASRGSSAAMETLMEMGYRVSSRTTSPEERLLSS